MKLSKLSFRGLRVFKIAGGNVRHRGHLEASTAMARSKKALRRLCKAYRDWVGGFSGDAREYYLHQVGDYYCD